jgi:hypothetical protein
MGLYNSIRHTTIERSITPRRATKLHDPARTGANQSHFAPLGSLPPGYPTTWLTAVPPRAPAHL